MNAALRAFVRERAGRRCEYCRLHEDDADFLSFHVEHVVAKQHGGTDDPDILCFACAECNWAKGPNVAGLFGGKLYPLFNRQGEARSFLLQLGLRDRGTAQLRLFGDHSRAGQSDELRVVVQNVKIRIEGKSLSLQLGRFDDLTQGRDRGFHVLRFDFGL